MKYIRYSSYREAREKGTRIVSHEVFTETVLLPDGTPVKVWDHYVVGEFTDKPWGIMVRDNELPTS